MPFFYDYYRNTFHWPLHDITFGSSGGSAYALGRPRVWFRASARAS